MVMNEVSLVAVEGAGQHFVIGSTRFEVRVPADQLGGAFGVLEFSGPDGPWTVPHVHRTGRESFYVLAGDFEFLLGDEHVKAHAGDFVTVAPNTVHMIRAGSGGGKLLALVPGQLEAMFIEMSRLGPEALTDPAVRADLAARHDSIPA
jgi:quercetin dioxygenase-like cupin family protein